MQQEYSTKSLESKFHSVGSKFDEAMAYIKRCQDSDLQFGVSYLDMAFRKIYPDDVIGIASPTGRGKSELVLQIASNAIRHGKKVLYFALESHRLEIELRIIYRLLARLYFEDFDRPYQHISYTDWKSGRCKLDKYYDQARSEFESTYKPLMVYYKERFFGSKEFLQQFNMHANDCDMWFLDHVQYIDIDHRETEMRAISEALMEIKAAAELLFKPGFLVSHIRKSSGPRALRPLVVDYEDLIGTSNIPKICTRVVTFGPIKTDKIVYADSNTTFPTVFRICKDRNDGDQIKYVGVVGYEIQMRRYDSHCELAELINGDSDINLIEDSKLPFWFSKDGNAPVL